MLQPFDDEASVGTPIETCTYDATGNRTGFTNSAGTQAYAEPDPLGTPRAVINPLRDVAVWRWDARSEAFGNSPPHEDPDGDGVRFVLDMRFPGQRYDSATGLNYNYFRDYDPGTGRYVQSDPIGLRGGISTYAYTFGNPISYIDPLGLDGDLAWLSAHLNIGRDTYGFTSPHPNARGRLNDAIGGRASNKCNVFVDDMLTAGGDPAGQIDGRPATASEWADPNVHIPGYYVISVMHQPRPGDVVALDGHVGLYAPLENGGRGTISASVNTQTIVHNDWGFRAGQQPTIRRCECDK